MNPRPRKTYQYPLRMSDTPSSPTPARILIAEDDPEDRMLTQEALDETALGDQIYFVEDGEELMDYLKNQKQFSDSDQFPTPGLILLDLNMPRKDGREALLEIKQNPKFCRIPVVIFTTSQAHEDVAHTYNLGGNSFITKPVSYEGMVEVIQTLSKYWFEVVRLP